MKTKIKPVDSKNKHAASINRFLSIKEVQIISGKSRSTLYRWINQGIFPKPCKIGPNSVAWPEEVVEKWREKNIKQLKFCKGFSL